MTNNKLKCATVDLLSEWRLFHESKSLSLSLSSLHQVNSTRMPFMRVHFFVQHWSIRVELLHHELRLQGLAIIYIYTYSFTRLPMFCLQNGSSLMLNLFIGFSYIKCFYYDRCCSLGVSFSSLEKSLVYYKFRVKNRLNAKSTACQTQNTL